MDHYPTNLERLADDGLAITWSDEVRHEISLQALRDSCPCANCRELRKNPPEVKPNALPVLSAAQTVPLKIQAMAPVGNYAYSIVYSDGHNSGIYRFELLRRIGETGAAVVPEDDDD